MIIKLSPNRREDSFKVVKAGDKLIINTQEFDLTPLPDGATLPASAIGSEWFVGDIHREDGELTLTLLFPIPANFSPDQAFPKDLLNVPDGVVVFPAPLPIQEEQPE